MKTYMIMAALLMGFGSFAQTKPKCVKVDDRAEGYIIYTYRIPEDGSYKFTLNGGLLPNHDYTTYHYSYQLQLQSKDKQVMQEPVNNCSQSSDGNVCSFQSASRVNTVSGAFSKNDLVELRLLVTNSEVNGMPHKTLHLADYSTVGVNKE